MFLPAHPVFSQATRIGLSAVMTVFLAASLVPATAFAQQMPPAVSPSGAEAPAQPQAVMPETPAPATDMSSPAGSPGQGIETDEAGGLAGDELLFLEDEAGTGLPHDLSPWGMFMAADWVVKGVMIGLAFASLVTWTVWLAKSLELAGARNRLRGALRVILAARSLDDAAAKLAQRRGAAVLLVRAAVEEMEVSAPVLDHVEPSGLKERVGSRLSRLQAQAGRRLSRGTGVLATIGSTAPFVGLFGTVWGIMNSFIGISKSQTTNLAVVAPGIAEALLATAIGLVAAIPAVVIYNVFARSVTGYRPALPDAGAGVERLVSRDLDYRHVPAHAVQREAANRSHVLRAAAE